MPARSAQTITQIRNKGVNTVFQTACILRCKQDGQLLTIFNIIKMSTTVNSKDLLYSGEDDGK